MDRQDAPLEAQRTVVVIPGSNFGPYGPTLFFPMWAAIRRDARPLALEWSGLDRLDTLDTTQRVAWVDERVRPTMSGLDPGSSLIVAKSLGTYASIAAADYGVPAIWVTPLLTVPAVVAGLRRATAPFLLAGGTDDGLWDGAVARELTPHVLELAGADHGLFVPGPLERSGANMAVLAREAEAFIDRYVWPDSNAVP